MITWLKSSELSLHRATNPDLNLNILSFFLAGCTKLMVLASVKLLEFVKTRDQFRISVYSLILKFPFCEDPPISYNQLLKAKAIRYVVNTGRKIQDWL